MILHVLDPDKYIGESYLEKERMIYDLNKHFIQFTRPKHCQDQRISFFDIYLHISMYTYIYFGIKCLQQLEVM